MVKKLDISVRSINLKRKFKDIHHAEIAGVSASGVDYAVLLNVWKTEEYKSLSQQIIVFNKLEINKICKFSKNLKWNCIYNLDNGFYLLGSKYSGLYSCAVLALFKENILIYSKLLDKGYSTEIHSIQKDEGDSFLISGSWYQCVPCGSHDDYVPVQWQSKIIIESSGLSDEDIDQSNPKKIAFHIPDSDSENYFVTEDYGISKYNNYNELIWNQGLGHFGSENLQPIHKMAPFFKAQNGKTIQDGVWFSGSDQTNSGTGFSEPLFGRVTAGGTILSFKKILLNFSQIYKIHTLIPGIDNNCLLIGETLLVGKGTGIFILFNHFSEGIWHQSIKYLNFDKDGFELMIQDTPEFHNRYLQIKEIFPQSERLEDLEEIIILGNADYFRDRNNGYIWSVRINNPF
ncbi:hypothetical protein [Flavobacterium limi]|uniref:Uncharacterized protein n=1 Tax=Flavobacterium limi TaxID=2045105 RepID=A0ABQ1ULN7_9FLAO|nr:hypothetical protein [Flavobacterium limi]GGF21300.1 hypothetical protein GCM10011518_33090 [Flavobacterium limi]